MEDGATLVPTKDGIAGEDPNQVAPGDDWRK
jgi:hypothetical protein